ncbi:MAG: hypothetical protein ACOC22_02055 [bacterium]
MIVDQRLKKKIEGVYFIDGISNGVQIATSIKPNIFRRFFTWLFLGWKWKSIKDIKTK